jgi:hypothetical protein
MIGSEFSRAGSIEANRRPLPEGPTTDLGALPLDFQGWDSQKRTPHPSGLFAGSTTDLGAPPLDFQGWDSQKRTPHPSGLSAGSTTDLGAPPLDFQGWDSQKRTNRFPRWLANSLPFIAPQQPAVQRNWPPPARDKSSAWLSDNPPAWPRRCSARTSAGCGRRAGTSSTALEQ